MTALELNASTVSLLTRHFRKGGLYDLIYFVASDSYAAQNAATAGAFVLSESYLYTVEMIEQSLAHLSRRRACRR